MGNVRAFQRQLSLFIDRTLSPAAQSRRLAEVARRERDALIAAGRASPSYRWWVDGREGAPEDTVAPAGGGQIVYRFSSLGAVTAFALEFLIARSPPRSAAPINPKTGKTAHYRDGFYVGVNGRFIPASVFEPGAVPPGAEIVIGNTQPYSRKVDVQLVGHQSLTFSVPPGLFDAAAKAIAARYGDFVTVKRVYTMRFPGQYLLRAEQVTNKGRSRRRLGKPVESPALIITSRR
ncbi:hypothetical protein [Azospirillum thermophilum]|uniref:Uncharacterized protein n=1 Tax=Azospirillum thermophilum TaxID=2202148 RepID=A0A2S2D1N3_9PROT|nr:hypothetical protein [Azospirillum thermophilum]AWK90347.1 hypothetical protein DEW08_30495 [Azospirillum thermophilum]